MTIVLQIIVLLMTLRFVPFAMAQISVLLDTFVILKMGHQIPKDTVFQDAVLHTRQLNALKVNTATLVLQVARQTAQRKIRVVVKVAISIVLSKINAGVLALIRNLATGLLIQVQLTVEQKQLKSKVLQIKANAMLHSAMTMMTA
jgi:hypothetical protein